MRNKSDNEEQHAMNVLRVVILMGIVLVVLLVILIKCNF